MNHYKKITTANWEVQRRDFSTQWNATTTTKYRIVNTKLKSYTRNIELNHREITYKKLRDKKEVAAKTCRMEKYLKRCAQY